MTEWGKEKAKSWLTKKAVGLGAKELGITGFLPQAIIPWGLSKIFGGKKDPLRTVKSQIAKFKKPSLTTEKEDTKKLVKHEPKDGDNIVQRVSGGEDVVSENIKKFTGMTDEQAEFMKRRNIVQGILDQGSYQGKELAGEDRNNLLNYIEQISKFIVDPTEVADGGRIDKPLTGRSRDI